MAAEIGSGRPGPSSRTLRYSRGFSPLVCSRQAAPSSERPANIRNSGVLSLSRLSFGTNRALTSIVRVRMVPAQPPYLNGVNVPMTDIALFLQVRGGLWLVRLDRKRVVEGRSGSVSRK